MSAGRRFTSLLRRAYQDENGQVLPFVALLTILFLGIGGLSLDLGQAYVSYRELQASTDAAALAGGFAMAIPGETVAQATAFATSYGSTTGVNVNPNLPSATISVALSCSSYVTTTVGIPCAAGAGSNNAITVTQTATLPTHFIQVLGLMGVHSATSLTLAATSFAAVKSGTNQQYNVAVIIDSTGSMGSADGDGNCAGTKEQCAMLGVQALLSGLTPCGAGSSSTTCASAFDSVSVFVFPNFEQNTASGATTCPGSTPNNMTYSTPAVGAAWSTPAGTSPSYQLSGYLDNYSSTNASGGSINATSPLGILTGADKSTCGLTTPISGEGTYLAGAIYAAQSSLVAQRTANPGSLNAMIILTDGDANAKTPFTTATGAPETMNATGIYPSLYDQCQQAITAANYATANSTTVYVVAYGASTSGCNSAPYEDTAAYQDPCTNLKAMATSAATFYSDAGTTGACPSSDYPALNLSGIFTSISTSFTNSRLIPHT